MPTLNPVRNPNTIYLGGGMGPGGEGGMTVVNDYVAGESITPGMQIETYKDGSVTKWRKQASATTVQSKTFALEQLEWNKGVDDAYAAGDLVKAGVMHTGSVVWALVPSGQDIAIDDFMQSNGDGKMKEATSAAAGDGVAAFKSRDQLGAVTADTRCRIEVL